MVLNRRVLMVVSDSLVLGYVGNSLIVESCGGRSIRICLHRFPGKKKLTYP